MAIVSAINQATGEQIELPVDSLAEVIYAWQVVQQYEKAAESLREQMKQLVPGLTNERGLSEEHDGCQFRVSTIQRTTYDKATLRQLVIDADFFDTLMKPDKTLIDSLLKGDQRKKIAPDPRLAEIAHQLRQNMIADGRPYQVIKLEKLSRIAAEETNNGSTI